MGETMTRRSRRGFRKEDFVRSARICMAGAAAVAFAAIGCGSSETVTVTEESATPPPETVTERADPPSTRKKSRPAVPSEEAGGGGDAAVVPDLVGLDHQLAQDTLQAEGFYLIDETDCSGEDRLLLWDRNWIVVEQDPPGGTNTSVDDTITLCSVKDGEQ
jgi:PASTA domain